MCGSAKALHPSGPRRRELSSGPKDHKARVVISACLGISSAKWSFPLYEVPVLPLLIASLNAATSTATTEPTCLNQDFQSEDSSV